MRIIDFGKVAGEYYPEGIRRLNYVSDVDGHTDCALALPGGNHDSPLAESISFPKIVSMI